MSERTSYAHGTPNWVDLGTPDQPGAAAFYGGIFGWEVEDLGPEAGGYQMCNLRGKPVAGLGPQGNPDVPPYWTVYVAVDDADAAMAAADANGGSVVMPGMDVMDAGRMGIVADPAGGMIAVWQANQHPGAALVNEHGAFCWNELGSADLAAVRPFYTSVFGWGEEAGSSGDAAVVFTVDGAPVCGAHTAGPGEPNAWSVWFLVDDCDATTEQAVELGGTVIMPPNDMDFGRGSMIVDPAGAALGVAKVHPERIP
jgi:predicted enzyme related to lactoylglutathione lyase